MDSPEMITRADVVYLWHSSYWDGPITGACEWRGVRYWFSCVAQEMRPTGTVDEDNDPVFDAVRIFHLYELSEQEWTELDRDHELFRQYVGTHTDYDRATQRREVGALRPQSEWPKYYDRARPAPLRLAERAPVAVYEN